MRSGKYLLIVALFTTAFARAQSSRHLDGPLVVWVVLPGVTTPVRVAAAPPLSGSMPDQTAGSYGQTNGSFGQTAGSYGQTAGSYGQTLGSFGQTAGSYGQTSASYGQTVGSFGTSLENLPATAARANGTLSAVNKKPSRSHLVDDFVREADRFQGVEVHFEDVPANELESRLAQSGHAGPDLLIGSPLPAVWSRLDTGLVRRYGLVTLMANSVEEQTEEVVAPLKMRPQFSILHKAPHPEMARAFVRWALGATGCLGCPFPRGEASEAVAAGTAALRDVLQGARPGGVDPEYALADPAITQAVALGNLDRGLYDDLRVEVDVLHAHANERFAMLELSATLESHAVYGVLQALVILRRDDKGKWRTLQVTPSLRGDQLYRASHELVDYTKHVNVEQVVLPLGVSQAAPVDGDIRPLHPELWWDNYGGATLQIVESQARVGPGANAWLGSNLFFVPDTNQHLRTQVAARFASNFGQYRWRVWSIGIGGTVTLSPWLTFRVTG